MPKIIEKEVEVIKSIEVPVKVDTNAIVEQVFDITKEKIDDLHLNIDKLELKIVKFIENKQVMIESAIKETISDMNDERDRLKSELELKINNMHKKNVQSLIILSGIFAVMLSIGLTLAVII